MNSYPPELLMQLAPVMFVAGLDPQAPQNAQSPQKQERDPFTNLMARLREALLAQRKLTLWNPPALDPQSSLPFHVALVDKNIRFPPRKFANPDDPHAPTHSPLSPLTPTSPLHPDGVIAPIWLRKHTTLVPSVFVLFIRLFEYASSTARSPLDGPDPDREHEERKRDEELSADVALRKKSTAERGVKLTVVLIASRKMLDDPSLDSRLTFIRRHSGLDSRAALFVLSPVSQTELGDFVKSLQQALYEPALEYYIGHSKRVRRKRNRHANQTTSYVNPISTVPRPLRPEGWTVRYEYKMACFAEFRGEADIALKHYQDSYFTLAIMFGSTAILPPRTKRWAEAKVLVDCINIKICKLYLYNNEHSLALSQHNSHMRKFADFSRGWGIGEETFEYWSWLARQHRLFSELLEYGIRSKTLTIPIHIPLPPLSQADNVNPGLRLEPAMIRGLNPSHALQHPGFYYYAAAKCAEMRRKMFAEAVDAELMGQLSPNSLPGFVNEKKVDHLAIIIELYTKAYDHFKQYTSETQGRLILWVAYRIAETYYEAGQCEMAVKFFERIAKTYRSENWGATLRPLLSTWYACARQLGDVELSVKLLVELLFDSHTESEDPTALEEDLVAILRSTVPSSGASLIVGLSDAPPTIFDCNVVFWKPHVMVGEPAAFQVWLTAPRNNSISSLPIIELCIQFGSTSLTLLHDNLVEPEAYIDVGEIEASAKEPHEAKANLRWKRGEPIVVAGFGTSDKPMTFAVTGLLLRIQEGDWNIEVPFVPATSSSSSVPMSRWLCSTEPLRTLSMQAGSSGSVSFTQRPHLLVTSFSHQAPAYVDEEYSIVITVTNADERALDLVLDVLLQPCEVDHAMSSIRLDEEQSSGLIKGISLGTLEHEQTVSKTLSLFCSGSGGDRILDISVQSRLSHIEDDYPSEHLQTIIIPTVSPFQVHTEVEYRRALRPVPALTDLRTFDGDSWDVGDSGDALIRTSIECVGPWTIKIEGVDLVKKDNKRAAIRYTSVDDTIEEFPAEYQPGDRYAVEACVSLQPIISADGVELLDSPADYQVSWRRITDGSDSPNLSISRMPLPALEPPIDDLIALLDVPPIAKLHTPSTVRLTVRNRHPSKSAIISIALDFPPPGAEDPFIVAGLRSGRLPILLPGAQQEVTWRIVPLECGNVSLPKIRVLDQRDVRTGIEEIDSKPDAVRGREVDVIDMRSDGKPQEELLTIMVVP